MANDISNYLADALLDHTLKVSPFTVPTTLYMSLHDGDPGKTGANELTVVGGDTDYARIVCSACFQTAAVDGVAANDALIEFAPAGADWNSGGNISYGGIWDAITGGNFLFRVNITVPKSVLNGQTASFAIGDVDIVLS